MVYRVYVEKRPEFAAEAKALFKELTALPQCKGLTGLRVINRYDVENIDEELFAYSKKTVFSEPQLDIVSDTLDPKGGKVFAVEYLPGQFDQRADSAAQCIQLISQKERPLVRTAKVYVLYGDITDSDLAVIQKYVINPVESRLASLDKPETLKANYEIPTEVPVLDGFINLDEDGLKSIIENYGLAMDLADITLCRDYFKSENRNPTLTEIKMLDTYWSDHCRHTTFLTTIDHVSFEDETVKRAYERYLSVRDELGRTKPINLMDIATIGARYLKSKGLLKNLDESDEINACTVKIEVEVDGKAEPWLLLFKNETHNHPTEIEPFGGAATCIGGAIRDPLSGRGYVYQAMRITGAANPLTPIDQTMPGKLPQRKIVTTAAAGYSSYGNQIGLATGLVDEIYHDGYIAKHMELGAVLGAAPRENVRRETPQPGDVVVLLGGRTGRDGCGGATGSSKSHSVESLEQCGAEVQKGNAPEERKIQRLFRNKAATTLIKRCNDFGAGGVSVAIGELADGLRINLNAVPKKYDGLDGTELAISESQERMAVVLAAKDVETFKRLAYEENLEATVVAEVTAEPRLVMEWNGKEIVNISREFLNSNGAAKHTSAVVSALKSFAKPPASGDIKAQFKALVSDLNVCSKRGLSERFDSTIGAGTVLMPFGGKRQLTPIQAMVAKIPVLYRETTTCSAMAYGYNPFITEKDPFRGAYLAVIESVAKLIATGADYNNCYLTFQEYFERLGNDPKRWGKPLAALLGALSAQLDLGLASIGGKDSMSGSFEDIDVPPTLISFAVSVCSAENIISPEFKKADSRVVLLSPKMGENGLPDPESFKEVVATVSRLIAEKKVLACMTPTYGGIAEAVFKMCLGNRLGFMFCRSVTPETIFGYSYGSFILELSKNAEQVGTLLGVTTEEYIMSVCKTDIDLAELEAIYEGKLEPVYPCNIGGEGKVKAYSFKATKRKAPAIKAARPKVLIPVFPGTNCEYDTAYAFLKAGAEPEVMVINNLTPAGIVRSVDAFAEKIEQSQIIFIPGGFSSGDEPDGSGKFITAFFRNPKIKDAVHRLLYVRDGLMGGICNGFQALIKLGLVPYGEIRDTDVNSPTLTFNTIARHQSRLVRVRVASNKSPWLSDKEVGEVGMLPISHGEGRFVCDAALLKQLAQNGQIATQYVDMDDNPTMDIAFNPNGSVGAVEGITSPDGRVFGRMGHSERYGQHLYKNVEGNRDFSMFKNAAEYFK